MNKIIILEGPDNTGKDTQQKLIIKNLYKEQGLVFQTFHFSNCPFDTNKEHINYSTKMYDDMFKTICLYNQNNISAIFNRSHLGEAVYSPLYRKYDGNYIFNIENKYFEENQLNSVYLIVFVGNKDIIFSRDDKLSFYKDANGVQKEKEYFEKAFEKSKIPNKLKIDITGLNIQEVNNKIMKFLK